MHVLPDPALSPGLCVELARRIAEAAPQLPPPHVVRVETLSGFFDRA